MNVKTEIYAVNMVTAEMLTEDTTANVHEDLHPMQ